MGGQVGGLSAQDMADLAAYFSSQTGTLHVIR
jgi:cytochrome c553